MPQATIYLPEAVANDVRKRAMQAGKSLSAYIVEILDRERRPTEWPEEFRRLYAACSLPEVVDPPPEDLDLTDPR
ncbi:MAG: hypothetical protein KF729_28290 [Sandaracinaceae bacterium]|nr:hypothetical protein [Sandaracinaceae bacterium]